jgi:hypothetical protein
MTPLSSLNGSRNLILQLAKPYPMFDGAITPHFMPYKMLRYDTILSDFERVHPRWVWENERTGEQVTVEPEDVRLEREAAEAINAPMAYTEWVKRDVWGSPESLFVAFEGYVVHIDFALPEIPLSFMRGIKTYWDNRTGNIRHDWELFQFAISVGDLYTPFWLGLKETRDPVSVPKALAERPPADADPNSSGRGETNTTTPETTT